jgi:hypothetical protein
MIITARLRVMARIEILTAGPLRFSLPLELIRPAMNEERFKSWFLTNLIEIPVKLRVSGYEFRVSYVGRVLNVAPGGGKYLVPIIISIIEKNSTEY